MEKPSGISTVRHPSERDWDARRKSLAPTLEDMVPRLLGSFQARPRKGPPSRLRIVQRLDKETSGLVVFARTVQAEQGLGRQFHAHTVVRRYLAIVPGFVPAQRIANFLRDSRRELGGSSAGHYSASSAPGPGSTPAERAYLVQRVRMTSQKAGEISSA